MKHFVATVLASGCTAALLGAAGCNADCMDTGTCGPYSPTGGSAGNVSGSGGTSAAGGRASGGSAGNVGAVGGNAEGGQSGEGGMGATAANGGRGGASEEAGSGGEGGAGSPGGEAGMAGGEPPCDSTQSPDEDACVIDEKYGVFVSPSGDDASGDGSRKRPYATLEKAIDVAASRDRRVYACADGGPYEESVSITANASGIALFGGFSCDGWSYSTSTKSRIASPTALALRVDGVAGVRIADFRVEASDGAAPGESSIGAFVVESTSVVFQRTSIEAGNGKEGANGTLDSFTYQGQASLDGNAESPATMGGGEKVCDCQASLTSVGAIGGAPSSSGQSGAKGLPDHGAGNGGTPASCGSGGTGVDGANAPPTLGALGALTLGSLAATGWMPAAGEDGGVGQPGQGGGGGASRNASGHGGGGGCGGCGGNGGKAGQGGGAAVALLVLDSEVTLEAGALTSADAGRGGDGHAGQAAQSDIGVGGSVASTINSCPGGNGGFGADGAPGGGAAGGVSIGILWKGDSAPIRGGVTITTGMPGAKGIGGEPGVNDGVDGIASALLETN